MKVVFLCNRLSRLKGLRGSWAALAEDGEEAGRDSPVPVVEPSLVQAAPTHQVTAEPGDWRRIYSFRYVN